MFFPRANFSFTQDLERHWQVVLDECLSLPGAEFDAWPEKSIYNRGWDVYGLVLMRQRIMENCIFCPRTVALLQAVPGLVTAGFSRLAPGTEITPHVGYTDQVLRLHLALRSSAQCGIRVGAEVRHWIPGECLIFDDTVEHEAWNRGHADRLVLLVDFAKP
ncbi:aspartyl/asparaginyl beta-hydroxylase domain-containing protein [Collimonas silvisoli]|uniref:aspartyl/asparaginyl beta-hydroxylase domain-containing protein n=1 Tax=Collimonas silvisoli TaxID=2825884 RepID=UPI001B8C0238|nr:aspartyl/asparaginyl beta-hydroxylase domain-containing protein [Collimonas silvisoli]